MRLQWRPHLRDPTARPRHVLAEDALDDRTGAVLGADAGPSRVPLLADASQPGREHVPPPPQSPLVVHAVAELLQIFATLTQFPSPSGQGLSGSQGAFEMLHVATQSPSAFSLSQRRKSSAALLQW